MVCCVFTLCTHILTNALDISRLLSEAMEQSRVKKDREADEKRAAHVRPWDKGKGNYTVNTQ